MIDLHGAYLDTMKDVLMGHYRDWVDCEAKVKL